MHPVGASVLFGLVTLLASLTIAAQSAPKTVWDGIYSDAQAARGEPLYQRACSYCHQQNLIGFGGDSAAAALTGARFFVRWKGESVGEMFSIIAETMPPGSSPVTLTPQDYADVMAYIFKFNAMPAGAADLLPDRAVLDQIQITDAKR